MKKNSAMSMIKLKTSFGRKVIFFLFILNFLLFSFWISGYKKAGTNPYPEITELKNLQLSFADLSNFFTKVAKNKGARYAYELLKIAPIPPNTDLHLLGHVVGEILYKQQGVKGIKICTDDFRNACSHTIVIGLFTDKGENALTEIANACRQSPGGKGAYTMCFHGLGHGVLAYAGYDLPKAIEICKKTGTASYGQREYIECVGGTIMEIVGGGGHDHELWERQSKKYLTANNPLSPCSNDFMPDEAKAQCYTYLTPHLLLEAGGDLGFPTPKDFEKAFLFCNQINNNTNRSACYGGFGKEFVVLAKDRDIRNIEEMTNEELKKIYGWCLLAKDQKGISNCINTALYSIYWGGENKPDASVKFCGLIQDESLQTACFENLINSVSYYIDEKNYREKFCEKLPLPFHSNCQKKLNLEIK